MSDMLFGQTEVAYYELTPVGVTRLQNRQFGHLDPAARQVLQELGRLGGTAEWDELKFYGTADSPTVLSTALSRLVDMGLVRPVGLDVQQ